MNNLDVRELREKLGLKQQEFADLIGVSRNTVINYEKGMPIPDSKSTILRRLKLEGIGTQKQPNKESDPFTESLVEKLFNSESFTVRIQNIIDVKTNAIIKEAEKAFLRSEQIDMVRLVNKIVKIMNKSSV